MKMKAMAFLMAAILSAALPGCGSPAPKSPEPAEEETVNESIEETEEHTGTKETESGARQEEGAGTETADFYRRKKR